VNHQDLDSKVISLKRYLKRVHVDLNVASPSELRDLAISKGNEKVVSAFQIVGEMEDEILVHDNIIIPVVEKTEEQ